VVANQRGCRDLSGNKIRFTRRTTQQNRRRPKQPEAIVVHYVSGLVGNVHQIASYYEPLPFSSLYHKHRLYFCNLLAPKSKRLLASGA
jgi:hypothetical protein